MGLCCPTFCSSLLYHHQQVNLCSDRLPSEADRLGNTAPMDHLLFTLSEAGVSELVVHFAFTPCSDWS